MFVSINLKTSQGVGEDLKSISDLIPYRLLVIHYLIQNTLMISFVRILLAIVLFLISLLTVFKAPTNFFWKVSILVTEYSYILIVITLISFFIIQWNSIPGGLLIIAFVLFLTPLIRAIPIIQELPAQLTSNFSFNTSKLGNSKDFRSSPFVLKDYIFGIKRGSISIKNLIYKHTETGQSLDLAFYPSMIKNKKSPCIVVIHGGGWDSGDKFQLGELNFYLAEKGFSVASISYRLAPIHTFPAPIEDTKEAIAYLKKESVKLNIDSSNFVLLGRSAGGQIALLTAYTAHDPSIKGVISFYAPADMVWGYSIPGNPLIMDSRKVMEDYLGGTIKQVPEIFKASSPNEFVSARVPPTLLIHGIRDELVAYEHSLRLQRLLKQAKVKHLLVTLPWATHGCDFNFNGPSAQLSTFAIERFIQSVTSTPNEMK
jgi:acetyl esterase/lipase